MKKLAVLTMVCLAVLPSVPVAASEPRVPVTGILGAMASEVDMLREKVRQKESSTFLGIRFVTGELLGRKVVIAETGIGKVNAAVTTTLLLDHFKPSEIIFTGIAGGINPALKPGDILIGVKLAQHDMGEVNSQGFQKQGVRNPLDGKCNPVFIASDPAMVSLAELAAKKVDLKPFGDGEQARKPRITRGIVATGDVFVASQEKKAFLRDEFGADVVEMEGAAVAQVCYQQKVPFVVVRSLSDTADEKAADDVHQFYKTAAENSATLTLSILGVLSEKR